MMESDEKDKDVAAAGVGSRLQPLQCRSLSCTMGLVSLGIDLIVSELLFVHMVERRQGVATEASACLHMGI